MIQMPSPVAASRGTRGGHMRPGIHQAFDREAPRWRRRSGGCRGRRARADSSARSSRRIDRLADAQRLPILLCTALEGLSRTAAQQLGWPLGTIKSRLVRGRKRLEGDSRRRLAPEHPPARGVDDLRARAVPVPLVLALATTRATLQFCQSATTAGAISPSITLLLQRELTAVLLAKISSPRVPYWPGAAAILIGSRRPARSSGEGGAGSD